MIFKSVARVSDDSPDTQRFRLGDVAEPLFDAPLLPPDADAFAAASMTIHVKV